MMLLIVLGQLLFGPETDYGVGAPGSGSSTEHWFGTDALGRDVLSRFLDGGAHRAADTARRGHARRSSSAAVSGCSRAYWGGWPDIVISKVFDVVLTLPPLLIVLVIIGGLGASTTVLDHHRCARVRAGLGSGGARHGAVGDRQSVRALRAGAWRVATPQSSFREVLPNVSGPDAGGVRSQTHLRHPLRGDAQLPRPGRPAAGARLGAHGGREPGPSSPWRRGRTLLPALGITALAVAFNLSADALSRVLGRRRSEPAGRDMSAAAHDRRDDRPEPARLPQRRRRRAGRRGTERRLPPEGRQRPPRGRRGRPEALSRAGPRSGGRVRVRQEHGRPGCRRLPAPRRGHPRRTVDRSVTPSCCRCSRRRCGCFGAVRWRTSRRTRRCP